MIDPYTRAHFSDNADPDLADELFCYAVTRRDRTPDQHDPAHEKVALKLEELAASIGSDAPPALREVFDPSEPEVQTSIFTALAAESLGIVRERAPEAYDEFIAGLLAFDKRHASTRERLFARGGEAVRDAFDADAFVAQHLKPRRDAYLKIRWMGIGFLLAVCLGDAALLANAVWGPSTAQRRQAAARRPFHSASPSSSGSRALCSSEASCRASRPSSAGSTTARSGSVR